jgi:7-cyano-7-deazaguanine synthase
MAERLRPATVLFSGGIDSASCAYFLKAKGFAVNGLYIDFGQIAAPLERRAIASLEQHLGVTVRILKVDSPRSFLDGEIVGRNAYLAFSALVFAETSPTTIAMGLHAGTSYYDSSLPFTSQLERLISECSDGRTSFLAPFLTWTKGEVYQYFLSTGIPLGCTYSCEAGTDPPCGSCLSCRDRTYFKC